MGNRRIASLEDARSLRDALAGKGWKTGGDLSYVEAEGAAHNEKAWSARAGRMLEYLFGR